MARQSPAELTCGALMSRRSWKPLPAVCVLWGDGEFLQREIQERFARELSAEGGEPWIRRFRQAEREPGKPTLAEVLEDLQTPSFLASTRLVVVEAAEQFLSEHQAALEPFVAKGFAGGHLVLLVESLDRRTRFAKTVAEKGWAVACQKPFDRPPPWKPEADPWDNDLCRWVAARARQKDLELDLETAHALCQRAGSDLATLEEELEKLKTYLGSRTRKVDLAAVEAVAGQLSEDSIFDLVDSFLSGKRAEALRIARRLLRGGYHPPKGPAVYEPVGISSMFIGALVNRLRALRRAHALAAAGKGPDEWIAARLTSRPFLPRFQRDLQCTPPERIARAFAVLLDMDRAMKAGDRAEPLLEAFLLKN